MDIGHKVEQTVSLQPLMN